VDAFYILIVFLFHLDRRSPRSAGALVIVGCSHHPHRADDARAAKGLSPSYRQRQALAEASRRNAEALRAMGMGPRVGARWCTLNEKFLTTYQRTSDVSGGFGAMSKVMLMLLQSAVLASAPIS